MTFRGQVVMGDTGRAHIQCIVCGEERRTSEWHSDPGNLHAGDKPRCEDCWKQLIADARVERKAAANNQLTEWC